MTNKQLGFDKYKSLIEFQLKFHTDEICLNHLKQIRFPDGLCCIKCGNKKLSLTKAGFYACSKRECTSQFTVRTGTIFANIRSPLRIWFAAVYIINKQPKITEAKLIKLLGIKPSTAKSIIQVMTKKKLKDIDIVTKAVEEKTLEQRWREYQIWKVPLERNPMRIT